MINTKKFKTRSEIIERNNGTHAGVWEIAIDIGYSGVKLFSPNKTACFPYFAVKIDEEIQYLSGAPSSSIMYKDNKTGEIWLVGELAQDQISPSSSDENERSMYGRDRYDEPIFKIASATGLGIGLMENEFGRYAKETIIVQSGLPESYLSDTPLFKEAIAGDYDFSLKVADNPWVDFAFTIKEDNVFVMSQPKGTLYSACIKNDGSMHADVNKYLSSNVIIFDPGFGTFDLFIINNGAVVKGDTVQNLGMRRVFHETSSSIKQKYGINIPVPAMQKYLESGTVRSIDRKTLEASEHPFGVYLYEASQKVCDEAIQRMFKAIGGLERIIDYNYLIVTGGTGAAWYNMIKDKFKNIATLNILSGNQNDTDLPFIYSNVRGYYYYQFNKLSKEAARK